MTLHIGKTNHTCIGCQEAFIPFGNHPKCPNCGTENFVSEEYSDFIKQCAASAYYNREKYGAYHPGAWFIGTFSDFVQSTVYKMLDLIEKNQPRNVGKYVENEWKFVQWYSYQYKHILDIFERVYKEMLKPPADIPPPRLWRRRTESSKEKYRNNLPPPFFSKTKIEKQEYIQIPNRFLTWFDCEVLLARGKNNSVYIYTPRSAEKMGEELRKVMEKRTEGSYPRMAEFLVESAHEAKIDPHGKLTLPDALREHLGNKTGHRRIKRTKYGLTISYESR